MDLLATLLDRFRASSLVSVLLLGKVRHSYFQVFFVVEVVPVFLERLDILVNNLVKYDVLLLYFGRGGTSMSIILLLNWS